MSLQITGHVVPRRPSKSGESFSIRRGEELLAVVDVGSPCPCPAMRATPGAIPVLVLTHSDADHVGAAACLLSRKRVEEVWLPLDWYLLFRALPQRERDRVRRGDVRVERSPAEVAEEIRRVRARIAHLPVLVGGERAAEGSDAVASPAPDQLTGLPMGRLGQNLTADKAPQRVLGVLSTLEAAELERRIKMRVFSVDAATWAPERGGELPWQASGIRGSLTVVNAWETERPTGITSVSAEAFCLYLTWQNRRALVLMAHDETPQGSAKALLTSDCGADDLPRELKIPWGQVGAVAGLHHGSDNDAHDQLYDRLPADAVLLRTDCSSVPRLNAGWLARDPQRRACTACMAKDGRRDVADASIASDDSGRFSVTAHPCSRR